MRHSKRMKTTLNSLRARLARQPLHIRFAVVGSLVSLIGMIAIGNFVSNQIESGVVRNSAISSAVYMESFIAPLSQELAAGHGFDAATLAEMRETLESPPLSDRILSVKIWLGDGTIAYASDAEAVGQQFPPDDDLRAALAGDISATFDELDAEESAAEAARGLPLLEVYNPIHSILTGEVIAVAEFYLDATELQNDLFVAQLRAWAMVAAMSAATFAALFGIVSAGSRTIASQNRALAKQLQELERAAFVNAALRERVQSASARMSEMNERQMRRISAELHDGPAQALSLARLRLDALMNRAKIGRDDPETQALRDTLDEAMRDVRHMSKGLTLPDLAGRTVAQALDAAIGAHERRTGTTITRVQEADWPDCPANHPTLICVYRFVQEALMNAYRHAAGAPVTVSCHRQNGELHVCVTDMGPGFDADQRTDGLGLGGMRERAESIGGAFRIDTAKGLGTRLDITLPGDNPR